MNRQADRGQGGFQFVGDRGNQTGFDFIEVAQTRHIRKHQGHPDELPLLVKDGDSLRQEEMLFFLV